MGFRTRGEADISLGILVGHTDFVAAGLPVHT